MAPDPRHFRDLANAIRTDEGLETWKAFADRARISQAHLSQLRSGAAPLTMDTAERLAVAFPSFKARIEEVRLAQEVDQRSGVQALLLRIERLRAAGRHAEAISSADRLAEEIAEDHVSYVHLGLLRADLRLMDRNVEGATAICLTTIKGARDDSLAGQSERLDGLIQRLTHGGDFPESVALATAWIERCLSDGRAWRRYGCVLWYSGRLVDAYAALTMSLSLGFSRRRVLHARGQVLAELGWGTEALRDLDEVLTHPVSPTSTSYARAARARALALVGRATECDAEFKELLRITPDNSWLYFHIGQTLDERGQRGEATNMFRASLDRMTPPLNLPKEMYVIMRLSEE